MRVRGRSMLPTYQEGDIVLVRAGERPRPGAVAVVRLPVDRDGVPRPIGLKRLVREDAPGLWWIDSDNAAEGVTSFDIGAVPAEAILALARWRLPRRRRRPVLRRHLGRRTPS